MAHYIVKTCNAEGRLVGRFEFTAASDQEAEAGVRDLLRRDWSQELWRGNRWVRTWPAGARRAALAV
jgi:hypothetical protein